MESDSDEVFTVHEFDENTVADLRDYVRDQLGAGSQIAQIDICSSGGECYNLLGMIDIIESVKRKMIIQTFAAGKALSAGCILLAAGTPGYRYAGSNATIMYHQPWDEFNYDDSRQVATYIRELNRVDSRLVKLVGRYTGRGSRWLMKQRKLLLEQDWHMDAKTAKKFGFVDHVGVPW